MNEDLLYLVQLGHHRLTVDRSGLQLCFFLFSLRRRVSKDVQPFTWIMKLPSLIVRSHFSLPSSHPHSKS